MSAAALGEPFLDWWFAPWALGGEEPGDSVLARRHGYRVWCDAARIPADLPAAWDGRWQMMAVSDGALLRRAARLYAAMLAARSARHGLLADLPLAERRWCMGVALTQPLQALTEPVVQTSLEEWGIAELAGALNAGFAGLWPRLRLVLNDNAHDELPAMAVPADPNRSQRCWRMCLERATRNDTKEAA